MYIILIGKTPGIVTLMLTHADNGFTRGFQFSVAKATLQSLMSVRSFICPSVIKTPQTAKNQSFHLTTILITMLTAIFSTLTFIVHPHHNHQHHHHYPSIILIPPCNSLSPSSSPPLPSSSFYDQYTNLQPFFNNPSPSFSIPLPSLSFHHPYTILQPSFNNPSPSFSPPLPSSSFHHPYTITYFLSFKFTLS